MNPEWAQYPEVTEQCRANIENFLSANRGAWLRLYCEFEDQPEFLKIMKHVDIRLFRDAEAERLGRTHKAVKLWSVGSFWLTLFLVVVAAVVVVFRVVGWMQALLVLIVVEGLLLLVGAFTLRATGDVSENGLLELVKLALASQATFVRRLLAGGHPQEDNGGPSNDE